MPETVTFCGLVVAPIPVAVKLKEYVPLGKLVEVKAILPFVPPQVVGLVTAPAASVGIGFTVTLPVTLFEIQPFAFLTVKVYEYEVPVAALLKLTDISVAGKAAFVTVVMPVPEIE